MASSMDDDPFFIGALPPSDDAAPDNGGAGAASGAAPVEELIPTMILKEMELQTHLTTALFGYDIQQMSERPWQKQGAVTSDYFNYGFNEKTWRIFCAMQAEGKQSLVAKAESFYQRIEGIATAQSSNNNGGMPYAGGGGSAAPPYGTNQHAPPLSGPYGGGGPRGSGNDGGGNFFKTKMCQRYQEGRCTRGAVCSFAHGAHELRGGSTFAPPQHGPDGNAPGRMPYPMPPNMHQPHHGDHHHQPHHGDHHHHASHGDGSHRGGNYSESGVLMMPPMSGGPSYPQPPMHHEQPYYPPPPPPRHDGPPQAPTGFRMAPAKRDRGGEDRNDRNGGVFDPVLQ